MKTNTPISLCRFAAIAAAAMSIAIGSVQAQNGNMDKPAMEHSQGAMSKGDKSGDMNTAHGHGSKEMEAAMIKGMQEMQQMKMSGDVDKDFAMMMKMHHQQALDMAKVEIEHGKSAELKSMAKKMIKDQTKEIGELDAWLKKHP